MKKIVCMFIAIVLIESMFITPTQHVIAASADDIEILHMYSGVFDGENYEKYALYDIDKNGFPELILSENYFHKFAECHIYTYLNNNIVDLGTMPIGYGIYGIDENGILFSSGGTGVLVYTRFYLQNNVLIEEENTYLSCCNQPNFEEYKYKEADISQKDFIELENKLQTIEFEDIFELENDNQSHVSTSYDDGGEWRYTSAGMKYMTSLYSVDFLANVYAITEAFPTIIMQEEKPRYSVYGALDNSDTLTVGQTEFPLHGEYSKQEQLKAALHNHIKYIERVGGVMTGYAEQNPGSSVVGYAYGFVISWDIKDKHHYAKFCYYNGEIGYYDLEFSYGSDSEKYIPQLNATLKLIIGEA